MAHHYSTTDFFRQMPNALLAHYFQNREFFDDLDFSAMKETKLDALFDAWHKLPNHQCNIIPGGTNVAGVRYISGTEQYAFVQECYRMLHVGVQYM